MAGQKRAADDLEMTPTESSSFIRRGGDSVAMPNLRLVVLTSDVLIDGREAAVSAITKLFESTNSQVGYSIYAAPLGFTPQFLAEIGHHEAVGDNRGQTAPSGLPLIRVPSRDEILDALSHGPRYIHDVLYELGLNPTRANAGYMPARHFVSPPSVVNTHIQTSPDGRVPSRSQTNLGAALSIATITDATRNLPMVQQYLDLLSQEQFHLYHGAKAFLARCKAHDIPVLVMTDHQRVVSQNVIEEGVPEDHIAIVMSGLTSSLEDTAGFYQDFCNEIVPRFELNPLPDCQPRIITSQGSTGTTQAESPGNHQAGNEQKPDDNATKDKAAGINPAEEATMSDATSASTATNTDTRAGMPDNVPIAVDDTPEPPIITVTKSADTTSATPIDQDSGMKSKGKRPKLELLKIVNPASSQGAQPRTPIREDPHTPTQPSGSFYSDTPDTPQTPTQRQLRRRAESPTTPTPPQGSRAHPRVNMGHPAPTYSTPSHAPRVGGAPGTPSPAPQIQMPGIWFASAIAAPHVPVAPAMRPVPENTAAPGTTTGPPARSRPMPPKDILMASSTTLHLHVTAHAIGAKKVWIKNQPGIQPRPLDQLPVHQDCGVLTLNNITELGDYLFGEEDLLDVDMMGLHEFDILQYSAGDESFAGASAAVSVPPSLIPAGPGVDKGKGKAVVGPDADSDDEMEILEVRDIAKE